jgi:large subunit ribosomal protein L25
VLYGHKQDNEHLTLTQKSVDSILRHHSKIVELQGAVNETALVSDLQFDPLGIEVLHLDLQRVDLNERVTVTVPIQFKGEPAGAKQGGIVIESGQQVEVECPAVSIPEAIVLQVTTVAAGENRTAGDLDLPENVSLVTSPETVIYHIEKPKGMRGKAAPEAEADAESAE